MASERRIVGERAANLTKEHEKQRVVEGTGEGLQRVRSAWRARDATGRCIMRCVREMLRMVFLSLKWQLA